MVGFAHYQCNHSELNIFVSRVRVASSRRTVQDHARNRACNTQSHALGIMFSRQPRVNTFLDVLAQRSPTNRRIRVLTATSLANLASVRMSSSSSSSSSSSTSSSPSPASPSDEGHRLEDETPLMNRTDNDAKPAGPDD